TAPAGYTPTTPGVGDRATDSSTGEAWSTGLTNDGDSDTTLDFGFVKNTPVTPPAPKGRVSVGDFVWQDTNKNGLQDAGEPGIPGVRLLLAGPDGSTNVTDVNGNRVGIATTDANGKYGFSNLPTLSAGQVYKVLITNPAGYTPTLAGQGWDRASDSSTGYAPSVPLTVDGASDTSLDFGFVKDGSVTPPPSSAKKVSVGDFVWLDANRNGIQDAGERGIAGVSLTLSGPNGDVTDVDGKKVGAVTTDANGKYSFNNLPALPAGQSYRVRVADPAGYVPTQPSAGADRAKDSSTSVAWSGDLTTDGASDTTLDFGFVVYNSSTSSS
ncbi:MAG: hypothetical protein INR72_20470, partial [Williamsia herbipolensis]|nr:hypothetical protein [Williamsia herbipolensis]